jgi:hypothetical protein
MKDAPKTIYLQVYDMDDCDDRFDMHEGVTWCQDKINDSDIEYIRADIPQQRPSRSDMAWVGLTLEERDHLWEVSRAGLPRYNTFAGLVEAKLKEKNNA